MESSEQQTQLNNISITDEAVSQIQAVLNSQENADQLHVRIYLQGGCGSIQYGMALDSHLNSEDSTTVINGLNVVVDRISLPYVDGATIDYEGGERPGFRITNPNIDLSALSGGCGGGSCGSGGCGGGSCGSGGCC